MTSVNNTYWRNGGGIARTFPTLVRTRRPGPRLYDIRAEDAHHRTSSLTSLTDKLSPQLNHAMFKMTILRN